MNSIEKITSRITKEAEDYAAEAIKTTKERAQVIISDAKTAAEKHRAEVSEKCKKECDAIINRAASSADILERNILLDAKSVIIDKVFKKAEKEFSEIDCNRYFDFLIKTLNNAIVFFDVSEAENEEETEEDENIYILTLNSTDKEKYGKKLLNSVKETVSAQGKSIELSKTPGDFSGGLKLRLGNIEISGTLESLFKAAKEKTEAKVYNILFGC